MKQTSIYLLIGVIVVGYIMLVCSIGSSMLEKNNARLTYSGIVTATSVEGGFVFYSGKRTYVYLDNNTDKITLNGDIKLKIGKRYELIVDGNNNLINAK
jgi:hypothetical protein